MESLRKRGRRQTSSHHGALLEAELEQRRQRRQRHRSGVATKERDREKARARAGIRPQPRCSRQWQQRYTGLLARQVEVVAVVGCF